MSQFYSEKERDILRAELDKIRRMPAAPASEQPDTVPTPRDLLERAESALRADGWHTTATQLRALLNEHRKTGHAAPLPYWPPCNPGCDPDMNGRRDRLCKCVQAREALGKGYV